MAFERKTIAATSRRLSQLSTARGLSALELCSHCGVFEASLHAIAAEVCAWSNGAICKSGIGLYF
jgi:hypothetical protein